MSTRSVVVLTDRPDRGRAFAEVVKPFARCRSADPAESWADIDHVQGVIADVAIDSLPVRRCLERLRHRLKGRRLPLVYLMRTPGDVEFHRAERLGATACFPPQTLPRTIATGLLRLIAPESSLTDLLVEHSFSRAGLLFTSLFESARDGRIDPDAIDDEIDPVLHALHEGGLLRWLRLVEAHDDTTVRHCLLVAGLAAHFALHLGLSHEDRASLVRAALVHDVGKALIPLKILQKPGPLDAEERAVMRTHAALGHDLLLKSGMTDTLALAATRHHHEMLDGSGYPDGLKGVAISDAVRLLTVCDIYAALIEHRPYRPAMPQAEALGILRRMTPDRLEKALVEAFAESLSDFQGAIERP